MHAVLVPLYLLLITPITSTKWTSGSQSLSGLQSICRGRRSRNRMSAYCERGVKLAHEECQYQFRHRHWNCTTLDRSMKKVLGKDTRETAFVNAIVSAGITYALTRACTQGELACSCEKGTKVLQKGAAKDSRKHPRGNNAKRKHLQQQQQQQQQQQHFDGEWKWGGCGDDVAFGIRKSKIFLNSSKFRKQNDMKSLVKLHNYVAGRMAIKKHMDTECKCHGLSGSCTVKTCWRKMPTFRAIGDRLKERFDGAVGVVPGNDGHSIIPRTETIKPHSKEDLVYSEEFSSKHFCSPNSTIGSLGTQGRSCNHSSMGEEGCELLCCGRGFREDTRHEVHNCNCKFHYCCEVVCDKCNVKVKLYTCN